MRPLALSGVPVTATAGTVASTVTLPALAAGILVMKNLGAVTAFVRFDGGTATATGAGRSYALLPGNSESISLSALVSSVSIVTASNTTDVQFQRADGGI